MTELASVLVVGTSLSPELAGRVRPECIVLAPEVLRAASLLATSGHAAVVLDLDEPPARVVDAIYRLRDAAPITPMLLIAHNFSRLTLNTAHQQRCELVARPLDGRQLDGFLERAFARQRMSREQLSAGLAKLAREYALDRQSADLLVRAAGLDELCQGEDPKLAPEEHHRMLRALLLRLGLRTVSGLHAELLRSAVRARSGVELCHDAALESQSA